MRRYLAGCLALPVILLSLGLAWLIFGPVDSGGIGCKVHRRYDVQAIIVADGRRYSGEATRVELRPRFRYGRMFSLHGCQSTYGRAIAFRLPRDRIVLTSASCFAASEALDEADEVNALAVCHSPEERARRRASEHFAGDAYVIEGIDAPRAWRNVTYGEGEVDLVRLRYTQAIGTGASDALEQVAPALLATRFEHNHWEGPVNLITDRRRGDRPLEHVAAMPIPDAEPLSAVSGR